MVWQITSDISKGLGFSGFHSSSLINRRPAVYIARSIFSLAALCLGFTVLISGIAACTVATSAFVQIAGVASICVGITLLMLAAYWTYGIVKSSRALRIDQRDLQALVSDK